MLSYTANVCEMPWLLTYIDSLERHKIIILNIKRRVEKEPRQCVFLIIKIMRPVGKKNSPEYAWSPEKTLTYFLMREIFVSYNLRS